MIDVIYSGGRKSSYSDGTGNCVEVASTAWHKSSHSSGTGNCVEVAVAIAGTVVGVRDSKQRGRGPVLEFTRAEWAAFISSAKNGDLDLQARHLPG